MKLVRRDPFTGYLDNWLWVPKTQINVDGTKAALTFSVNDEREVRFLQLYQETPHHLLVPREFWEPETLPFPVIDARPQSFEKVDIRSKITLDFKNPAKTTQRDAVQRMQESQGGILQLACGKGKTVCALELAAREKVPTMIIVDNTHLYGQWMEAINQFLEIPGGVGQVGLGEFDWEGKAVVLATYTTLANKADTLPQEFWRRFGLVIWDEAHHMGAAKWSRTAYCFYGKRIGLTATPTRVDGTHVIYDFHIGKVLYKDLTQDLRPKIYFYWTGLEIDPSDPRVSPHVCDVNGELHIGKVASYYGQWRARLDLILEEVRTAERQGRRAIVLSYSVTELINMFLLWNGATSLYSDIPYPTVQEIGETVAPVPMDSKSLKRAYKQLAQLREMLKNPQIPQHHVKMQIGEIEGRLKAHNVAEKCDREYEKRQRKFLKDALKDNNGNAGLMIGDIALEERMKMLREKQIVFAIMKYGREGLDEQSLDTVFVCEPISQKGGLQQLLGRILRTVDGKKTPVAVFFEDNVGPMMGMCQKLRNHLREWPHDEGGPFEYEHVKHPTKGKRKTWTTL